MKRYLLMFAMLSLLALPAGARAEVADDVHITKERIQPTHPIAMASNPCAATSKMETTGSSHEDRSWWDDPFHWVGQ
ncbi:MAG: hypothetical protein HYS14_07495 [Candidatus Rokubacteria bacterium]|nr:hypothetical protein [Candidatus Rokubacteria bacterium]